MIGDTKDVTKWLKRITMKFASPRLVSSRDSMPARFHAERREMHLVECMPKGRMS
jgi:hypothetical protein